MKFFYTAAEREVNPNLPATYEGSPPPPRGPGKQSEVDQYNAWLENPPTAPEHIEQHANWCAAVAHAKAEQSDN